MLSRPLLAAALVAAGFTAPSALAGPVPPRPTVALTVTPSKTATARLVQIKVTARVDEARITCVNVQFGDGTGRGVCATADGVAPDKDLGPHEVTYEWTHAYRRPGVWSVVATATAEDAQTRTGDGVAAAAVTVGQGANPSNGPQLPRVTPFQVLPPGGDRRATTVYVVGLDDDGWISEVVLDWGDGTRSRKVLGTSGCDDPLLTWPEGRSPDIRFDHRYKTARDRRVTARVVSVGCDGRDAQSRIETVQVQVPARF